MARLLPLARFGVGWRSGAVVGLFRCPCTCPDLGRFFCAVFKFYARQPLPVRETTPPSPPSRGAGRYGRKIQGRRPGRKKERTPCRVLKNQSRESRGEKLSPLALFPPVSREKRGPPPGRRPTGRCAPRLVKAPTTRRVRSTAPFPRPVPGGNPRGRSGPAMVPTEPPTDGAAPQGGPRDRACRPHPRASERLPHSSTTSPVENCSTISPSSSRSRANPLSPVQWPVRIWATPVSRRRRARARTSWSGVS